MEAIRAGSMCCVGGGQAIWSMFHLVDFIVRMLQSPERVCCFNLNRERG